MCSQVDHTLSLLYCSAVATGLPHRVTRNLHTIRAVNAYILDPSLPALRTPWNGQLPPNDPKYTPALATFRTTKRALQKESDRNNGLNLLGDVIGMAEGSGGLLLGRVRGRQ